MLKEINTIRVNEEVVERFEMLLEQAKKGEIRGISYVISYGGQATANGFAVETRGDLVSMLGELRFLEQRLIDFDSYASPDDKEGT